jgi:predicted alpha-1,6-mannanase (GH76 family)
LALGAVPLNTERHKFLVTAECVLPLLDNGLRAALGAEYTLAKVISFRVGYRFENNGNLNGPSAGLGVAFTAGNIGFRLDYAYRLTLWNSYESVDNNHFISLGANF